MSNETITVTYPDLYIPTQEMSCFIFSYNEDFCKEVTNTIEECINTKNLCVFINSKFNSIEEITWNVNCANLVDFCIFDLNCELTLEEIGFITNFAKEKTSYVVIENSNKNILTTMFFKSKAVIIDEIIELGEYILNL